MIVEDVVVVSVIISVIVMVIDIVVIIIVIIVVVDIVIIIVNINVIVVVVVVAALMFSSPLKYFRILLLKSDLLSLERSSFNFLVKKFQLSMHFLVIERRPYLTVDL